jgi:coxsackievirus/adenovirus receptor
LDLSFIGNEKLLYNYLKRACGCNIAGSWNNTASCDQTTGVCRCKANVEGQHCDKCRPGFFDLKLDNEFGCLPCFCYGHSSVCTSAPGFSMHTIESSFNRDNERWTAKDRNGREIAYQYNSNEKNIAVSSVTREPVYLIAPDKYLKDQKASYNQFLSFSLRIGEEGPRATVEDIVFEGAGLVISQPIFGQGNPLPSTRTQEYKFRLHEDARYGWAPRLGTKDFISILSNLTALKIRATYTPSGSGFVDDIRLESAQQLPYNERATWIEMCTCPTGYVGQFCESCAPGYRHDPPGGGSFSQCIPCNCNSHADLCDPDTGIK